MYDNGSSGGGAGGGVVFLLIVGYWLLTALPLWFIFKMAGKAPWAALIPIYNIIVVLEIVGRPVWWLVLLIIPCVSIIFGIIVLYDLARSFGYGAGFTVGLVLLSWIFLMILAFDSSRYLGPAAGGQPLAPATP